MRTLHAAFIPSTEYIASWPKKGELPHTHPHTHKRRTTVTTLLNHSSTTANQCWQPQNRLQSTPEWSSNLVGGSRFVRFECWVWKSKSWIWTSWSWALTLLDVGVNISDSDILVLDLVVNSWMLISKSWTWYLRFGYPSPRLECPSLDLDVDNLSTWTS